jgi:hypothetical protein
LHHFHPYISSADHFKKSFFWEPLNSRKYMD